MNSKLTVIIMCGGSGTRLWPLSREKNPKQFIKLNNDKYNLFQKTILRCKNIQDNINYIIFTNKSYEHLINKYLKEINIDKYLLVVEPLKKNTSPVICLASQLCENKNILIMSCDHIWDNDHFKKIVIKSLNMSNESLVLFGIKPTHPETGYGYIHVKNEQVLNFKEKPDIKTAEKYLESNEYFWNSGNFLINSELLKEFYKLHSPEMYQNIKLVLNNSVKKCNKIELNELFFKNINEIPFDIDITEKIKNIKCVIYDGIWEDIGSYKSLLHVSEKDNENNYMNYGGELINSNNIYVNCYDKNKLIYGIDISNLTIIDQKDTLLILNSDSSQKIKDLVKSIKQDKSSSHILESSPLVERPWGYYINIKGNDFSGHKIKKIVVYPGKRLSLQKHTKRTEHWVIVKGNAKVQLDDNFYDLTKDQHIYIPLEMKHRIENTGNENLEFIETQIGTYLGEDDIIRYEDDFGRI